MSHSTDGPRCPRCGCQISDGAADPLCPACLMSGALASSGTDTASVDSRRTDVTSEAAGCPRVLGGYRLTGLLGRGGMGAVYEAEHLATGRRVALKMLQLQLDTPDMRQRFLREGRLAAGINHPNSLYVFGSEEIDGVPVITMEIAGSGTLKDLLERRGPLPVPDAVDAILDVIAGLEAAQAGGVLHRDVKPSNCFIGPDGSAKVGDYGLSISTQVRDDSCVTATGMIMGTPAFAAPEQLRGDDIDVRADIYSVGATLYTLLAGRAPFEGANAVQIVANAVNQSPRRLAGLRPDVPPVLEKIVTRCLAKEPARRFPDYGTLRNALLPLSSREPEPASLPARLAAGWVDYLIAFLPAYVVLMLLVGADDLLVRPLVDRSLHSARFYLLLLGIGLLYFAITEGVWGCGAGKWLKGLRVLRAGHRPPGIVRATVRILIPIACAEGLRMPLMMALISDTQWTGLQTAIYVIAAVVCPSLVGLLAVRARRENGFATVWDLASGTRVVIQQVAAGRPRIEAEAEPEAPDAGAEMLGPFRLAGELVPGEWIVATDPVLRRRVWLLRRRSEELSAARRDVARPGRLRWLQHVQARDTVWDAFEATPGVPLGHLLEDRPTVPWATLRHWLHDLASELWDASRDQTLPDQLSLDHVWIAADGRAMLLDQPAPDRNAASRPMPVGDMAGQQAFLAALAAHVDPTTLPLHARPVLQNLEDGRFERLSFLAGTVQGLLGKPAELSRGIRAASLLMLPCYVWVAALVGRYHDRSPRAMLDELALFALLVFGALAAEQLLGLLVHGTASHAIFRLAIVDATGMPAAAARLVRRWANTWTPLLLPLSVIAWWQLRAGGSAPVAQLAALGTIVLWVGAATFGIVHSGRGLPDRLAGTWVVRR